MFNLSISNAVILLVVFFITNMLIAFEWARAGILGQPINTKAVGVICVNLALNCYYGLICINSTINIFNDLFYLWLIAMIVPIIFGLLYRYLVVKSYTVKLNQIQRWLSYWESNCYTPGERSTEKESYFSQLSEVSKMIIKLEKITEQLNLGSKICQLSEFITPSDDPYDELGNILLNCLKCKGEVKIPYGHEDHQCRCSCGASVYLKRIDNKIFMRVKLAEPIFDVTDQNKYNLALAYEMTAKIYRIMGKLKEANTALSYARGFASELHKKFHENVKYTKIISSIIFRKAEIKHVSGFKKNAHIYYHVSLELYKQISDYNSIKKINYLLVQLSA